MTIYNLQFTIKTMFSESQSFRKWLFVLVPLHVFFFIGIYQQVLMNKPFGDNPMPDVGLFIAEGVMILITLFFFTLKLETIIDEKGVSVRFLPIYRSYRIYQWSDINEAYVREFSPLMEYGGWGFRRSMKGNGKAWTTAGDKGLQIVTKDGTMFLVSTQKPEELQAVLSKYLKK